MKPKEPRHPSAIISFIPVIALVGFLIAVVKIFNTNALEGASQVALLTASGVCVAIAMLGYHVPWHAFEDAIKNNFSSVGTAIIMLLLIGAIGGTWMLSGVVPTMIYYGLKILIPKIFLFACCIIWLSICTMCFGGVMVGSGMIASITKLIMKFIRRCFSLVASTVLTGVFCNICLSDQYPSIPLTSNLFKDYYDKNGYGPRLLSRSTKDSATVTSVLIPWNTCGTTQVTVLNVATLAYLPYCIFNIISPIMSMLIAAIGYKIVKPKK